MLAKTEEEREAEDTEEGREAAEDGRKLAPCCHLLDDAQWPWVPAKFGDRNPSLVFPHSPISHAHTIPFPQITSSSIWGSGA
jgi:hypothetical protein